MRNKFQLLPMYYANEGTVRSDEAERADIRCVEDGCPRPPYTVHPRANRHPGVREGTCKFHRDTDIYRMDELARYRAEVERKRRHREWLQFLLTRDDQVCDAEIVASHG